MKATNSIVPAIPTQISEERAGQIAILLIRRIYARRGLDLRRNQLQAWERETCKRIGQNNPDTFHRFVEDVIVPAVASGVCQQIDPDAIKWHNAGKDLGIESFYARTSLKMVCADEGMRMSDFSLKIKELSEAGIATAEDLTSFVVHHLFTWHIRELTDAEVVEIKITPPKSK